MYDNAIYGYGVRLSKRIMDFVKQEMEDHIVDLYCGSCNPDDHCGDDNCGQNLLIPNCIVFNKIDEIAVNKGEVANVDFVQGLTVGTVKHRIDDPNLSMLCQSGTIYFI